MKSYPYPRKNLRGISFRNKLYLRRPRNRPEVLHRRLSMELLECRCLLAGTNLTVFQANFEDGDGGFKANNTGGAIEGLWHYSTGREADGLPNHTPTHNWYYGRFESSVGAGHYVLHNQHRGELSSPKIQLPECSSITGSFNYLLSTRPELDRDLVYVSVQYVDASDQMRSEVILSRSSGTLPQTDHRWRSATMDLSKFAGRAVNLLFTFDTADIVPYDPEGWYIDDVLITSSDSATSCSADLSVTKTDGKNEAIPGEQNTYTITVSNNGPSTVSSVTLTDDIPSIFLNPKFDTNFGKYDPVTHVWSGLSLAKGQSVMMTLNGLIDPAATGDLVNIVSVAPPTGVADPRSDNDRFTDTDRLTPQADLSVTKDDDKTTAVPGEQNSYKITVSNAGPSSVTSVVLTDLIPSIFLNPVFVPSIGTYDSVTKLWSGLSLAKGQSVMMTLNGLIDPAATGDLVNIVSVAPPTGVADPRSDNDRFTDTDRLTPQADLSVTKDDDKTTAVPGEQNSYKITVSNAGPSSVTSVVLTDLIPSIFLNPVFVPSIGTYDSVTKLWSGLSLAKGQSVMMTLNGLIDPAATGDLVNIVSVAPPTGVADPRSDNDRFTDTDRLTPQADLSVTKDDDKTTAVPGEQNSYKITVSNAGPSSVTSVVLTDLIPSIFLNPVFVPSIGTYDSVTKLWSGLSLAKGQSVMMTLNGLIDPAATGDLVNIVSVAPPTGVADPRSDNDRFTDTDRLLVEVLQTVQFISPLSNYRLDGPFANSSTIPSPAPTPLTTPALGKVSIKGYKWNDLNQNGVWDADEKGRAGWRIYIDKDNNGVFDPQSEIRAITSSDGSYVFLNIDPGTFTIREDDSAQSDGIFIVQKFPSAHLYTITLNAGEKIEGLALSNRVQGTDRLNFDPNFGGFDYSPFIRPADDYLGHLKAITTSVERQSLLNSLKPWQSFNIENTRSSSFDVLRLETSIQSINNIGGKTFVKIVDADLNPITFPFAVAGNSSKTLYAFFDPAIRNDAGDTVIEQFPDWFGDKKTTNGPFRFGADDHIMFITNSSVSYRVNLIGASTYDSDITYDGAVETVDAVRLNNFLSMSPIPIKQSNPLFDPTSDINARFANGAEDKVSDSTLTWSLYGDPTEREIRLGDVAPLKIELNKTVAPFLDLDSDNSSGARGVDVVKDYKDTPIGFFDEGVGFTLPLAKVKSVELQIVETLENGDRLDLADLDLADKRKFNPVGTGTKTLILSGQETFESYLAVLKRVLYSRNSTAVGGKNVTIQVTVSSVTSNNENSVSVAHTTIRFVSNVTSSSSTASIPLALKADGESGQVDFVPINAAEKDFDKEAPTIDIVTSLEPVARLIIPMPPASKTGAIPLIEPPKESFIATVISEISAIPLAVPSNHPPTNNSLVPLERELTLPYAPLVKLQTDSTTVDRELRFVERVEQFEIEQMVNQQFMESTVQSVDSNADSHEQLYSDDKPEMKAIEPPKRSVTGDVFEQIFTEFANDNSRLFDRQP